MRRLIAGLMLAIGVVACTDTPTAPSPTLATANDETVGWCSAGMSASGVRYNANVTYTFPTFEIAGYGYTEDTGFEYANARWASFDCKVYKTYPSPGWRVVAHCQQYQTRASLTAPWEGYMWQPGEFSCYATGY